jgi:hypothetical protein
MSIIHHTKRQLKNFNKIGQLISTLTRTFYEPSAVKEEDWMRGGRRGRRPVWPLSLSRNPQSAQLATANGTGRRGHLSTQIERVTF